MSLRAGSTVLGRYRLVRELAGTADLWRWEAEDQATGAPVEVVAPTLMASLRPGAAERFLAADARGEAGMARIASGMEQRLPVAVRPVGRGPWSPSLRLSPEDAVKVAAWLGRAILDEGLAPPEGLRAEDLCLDGEGVPRLAPTALVMGESVHPPARHRPPERVAGAPASPEGALYGLGVLLYRAVLGVDAVPGDTAAAVASASPRPARSLRPDLAPEVAALLDGLLSADPEARRAAILSLPEATPPALAGVVSPTAPSAPARPPVAMTRPAPLTAPDQRLSPWVVAVRPADLSGGATKRVAALAGTTASALREAGAVGRWVPVGGARTEEEAGALALRLAEVGGAARVFPGASPTAQLFGAVALLGLAGLLGLIGLFLWPLLFVALGLGAGGAVLAVNTARLRGLQGDASAALGQIAQAKINDAGTIEDMVSQGRRAVLEAELSEPVRQDLLASLDGLDELTPGPEGRATAQAALDRIRSSVSALAVGEGERPRLDLRLEALAAARREVEGGGERR